MEDGLVAEVTQKKSTITPLNAEKNTMPGPAKTSTLDKKRRPRYIDMRKCQGLTLSPKTRNPEGSDVEIRAA